MGAETTIHCCVVKTYTEWVQVSAVTLDEGRDKAKQLPGVVQVLEVSYEPGGVVT